MNPRDVNEQKCSKTGKYMISRHPADGSGLEV